MKDLLKETDKSKYYYKQFKNIIYAALITALFTILCNSIVEYKVVQNRKNYERFEFCYNIKGAYYCEKAN